MQEEEYESGYGEPSKAYRIVKGCFKGVLYGASALVWIVMLYVIFTNRDSKLMDRMYFTDATRSWAEHAEDNRVYQLYPADFMSRDGRITLNGFYYARETGELEFCVKYRKTLTDGNTKDGIRFVLTDQDGNEYPLERIETDAIGRYGYARVCFGGLSLPVEESDGRQMQLTVSLYQKDSDRPLLTRVNSDRTEEVSDSSFLIFTNFKKSNDPTDPTEYPDPTVTQKIKYDG